MFSPNSLLSTITTTKTIFNNNSNRRLFSKKNYFYHFHSSTKKRKTFPFLLQHQQHFAWSNSNVLRFYRLGPEVFGCSGAERRPSPTNSSSSDLSLENLENKESRNERIVLLLDAYRRYGHLRAKLDPLLGLGVEEEKIPELEPETYGLSTAESSTEIVQRIRAVYSERGIGVDFMHLRSLEERNFFATLLEGADSSTEEQREITAEEKVAALEIMLKIKAWEKFIAQKFPTLKRYSAEGAESMAVFYQHLLEQCPIHGIKEFIWGGAHRGRLALQNVLFQFPAIQLFRKMRGLREAPEHIFGMMGDVLTHQHSQFDYNKILANNGDGQTKKTVHVRTLPNPSHLEASLPVVYGNARARAQTLRIGDYGEGDQIVGEGILPVNHHGDGAFTGQGIVWETLSMSKVPHFRVGGSIHLIVNNQLAFTADKRIGRSSFHCGNVALAIDCPLICVNAESIPDVIRAARLVLAYRQRFRKEIFVELICYRRYGHNELDEPRFTQPELYRSIDAQKCMVDKFGEQLAEEGILSREEANAIFKEFTNELTGELEKVDAGKTEPTVLHLCNDQKGVRQAPASVTKWDTGFNIALLKSIGAASVAVPKNFTIHPNLQRAHVDARLGRLVEGKAIDWSTAESLAIGSALLQGFDVRLSGQDVGRGTFSQRHAFFVCQQTERVHIPLNHLNNTLEGEEEEKQRCFLEIANSPLSEASILGFEYGFAIENPKQRLVIWEAQFGDFYNGAQVQIDTLFASGESKWFLQNGLVLLLPHGFDGAGPDHSSAHIERFLSLANSREDQTPPDGDNVMNLWLANPSTSAQYFHLLRRQIVTPYKKPLVIITPKLLLRHPFSASPLEEFAEGTSFRPILLDPTIKEMGNVKKVVFCSGKHSLTLINERQKRSIRDVAIVRLEGICPFPVEELNAVFDAYSNAKSFVWSQEEPRNAGCWPFVQPRVRNAFNLSLSYAGRPELAWMATPIAEVHEKEINQVLDNTFFSS